MTEEEALKFLTQCADSNGDHWSGGIRWSADECPTCHGTNDAGWLGTPGSRYGRNATECAPIAYVVARIVEDATGEGMSEDSLDHAMSLVVNDSDEVARLILEHGTDEDRTEFADVLGYVDVDEMVNGYVECALWSSTDDDGTSLDENYSEDDVSEEAMRSIREDVEAFARDNATDLAGMDSGQAGHDFWLTRNHHGAGYWDRGLGEKGDRLTKASHAYGGSDLYVGDSGKLHCT